VVPVEVATTLTGVQSIALLVEKNIRPLCGVFHPGKRMKPGVSIRVKVGESGEIIAVVKAGDQLYSARKAVKVTVGGCD
jgi:sulfur-oxidizing protein SoxY